MIKRWGSGSGFRVSIALHTALWIAVTWQVALVQVVGAHNSGFSPDKDSVRVHSLKFDVVSIRLSRPGSSFLFGVTKDEYLSRSLPLAATILTAYFPQAFHSKDRMLGAPDWVWSTQYDFMGKVADVDLDQWRMQKERSSPMVDNPLLEAMSQAALAERCKLVAHRVHGEVQGFALVLDKHGPNWKALREAKPDEPVPPMALPISGGGRLVPIPPGTESVVTYINTSKAAFATQLPGFVGAPVEDRTGLNGKYDFKLRHFDNERDRQHVGLGSSWSEA